MQTLACHQIKHAGEIAGVQQLGDHQLMQIAVLAGVQQVAEGQVGVGCVSVADCDPYWGNVVLAMHLSQRESNIASAMASSDTVDTRMQHDPLATGEVTWDTRFSEFETTGCFGYDWQSNAVADTGVLSTKTIAIDISRPLLLSGYAASWTTDVAAADFEFLDGADSVVCALKIIDGPDYNTDLYYGSTLIGATTLAPRGNSLNNFVHGVLRFKSGQLVFQRAGENSITSTTSDFTLSCAADTVTKVRVSNMQARSTYTGGNGAVFTYLRYFSQADLKGHRVGSYGNPNVLSDATMSGGYAATVDGNARITVEDSDDFTFAGEFAIELQAKADDDTAYKSILSNITLSTDSWANGVDIYTESGVWKANLYDASLNLTTVTGPAVAETKQHVSLCRVGTTVKLYVEGVGGTGVTWAHTLNAKGLTIGNAWDTATRGWVGLVNEVLMYNTGIRTADFTPPTASFAEVAC